LVGLIEREVATGEERPGARGPSTGQLVYTASGRVSLQIMVTDRSKIATGSAEGYSSYFGRWEILSSEECIVHHMEGNVIAPQVGQSARRYYSFADDGRLSLATPPVSRDGGPGISTVFVWERM
jgi:amidase